MTSPRDIVPLPAGCPWSNWAPPDLQHCEANVCGWITTPANTWSNLAYLLVAAWLWRRGGAHDRRFAAVALIVGATSFAFHASFTEAGQFLDYVGMFGYLGALLALALQRLGAASFQTGLTGVIVGGMVAFAGFHAAGVGVQWIIVALVACALGSEGLVLARAPRGQYRKLALGAGLTAAGAALWALDYKRIVCDPENHWFQAHAAWHLLTAAAIVPLASFYAD